MQVQSLGIFYEEDPTQYAQNVQSLEPIEYDYNLCKLSSTLNTSNSLNPNLILDHLVENYKMHDYENNDYSNNDNYNNLPHNVNNNF